jgi:hypothetical protein
MMLTAKPNTTLLMMPLTMSRRKSTAACMLPQNAPLSMPISFTPTRYAPKMPSVENSAVRSGIDTSPPQNRGATTRASGSTAIISIADSCSVVFIRPISAVMALPARLAKSRPATTGPSSRTSDRATSTPSDSFAP